MEPPPLVLILLDQLRADAIGGDGGCTPNLDAIAARSVRFDGAVTNGPLCRPARTTLLTGRPVWEHRVATNRRVPDPDRAPSHVRRLRDEAGYRTVVVGKTHLHDGAGHLDDHRPVLRRLGYADAVELPDPMQYRLRSAHADALGPDRWNRWCDYAAHHRLAGPPPDEGPWHLSSDDHLDTFCARTAAARIRASDDRRLYLQVCFPGPHPPFDAPTRLRTQGVGGAAIPRGRGPDTPAVARARRRQPALDAGAIASLRCAYFAKVALVDEGVGIVWAALRETGLTERAWIVVTADHGELLGDHGLVGKGVHYDAAVRIPLLVHPPGGVPARVDRGAVDLLDVTGLLLSVAGLDSDRAGLSARVLHEVSCGGAVDRAVVFEALGMLGIRDGRYTLAWDRRIDRPVALHDRVADPMERINLVDDGELRTVREALVDVMRAQGALGSGRSAEP